MGKLKALTLEEKNAFVMEEDYLEFYYPTEDEIQAMIEAIANGDYPEEAA